MANSTPKSYHTDPTLYLYTSLTSGSSHIITATSRLETILKANKIPFQALDVATDEKARMLWGRRAGKRKLPGLVRMGMVVGDLEEVEEWNEYGELKDNVGGAPAPDSTSTPSPSTNNTPSKPPPTSSDSTTKPAPSSTDTPPGPPPSKASETPLTAAMRQAGFEAAKKAGDVKAKAKSKPLEQSDIPKGTLEKIDNSGPMGMPPPSGTTNAESAKAPETGESSIESKADTVPATTQPAVKLPIREKSGPGGAFSGPPDTQTSSEDGVAAGEKHESTADPKGGKDKGGRSTPEDHSMKISWKTRDVTAVTDEAEALPGTKIQEQDAASGEKVGESVAD